MTTLGKTPLTTENIAAAAKLAGTPCYLYDEASIRSRCREVLAMPNAFGLEASYAMKANSTQTILQIVADEGLNFDLSSLNEGRRARLAGIPCNRMQLTSQEVPEGQNRTDLENMMLDGLKYNVCSLQQLKLIADFASKHRFSLAIRVHPGVGSGESSSRNTGDKYSCFGVHLSDIPKMLELAKTFGIIFDEVHVHIGSGGDPKAWRDNIGRELDFVERFFPDAVSVNLGGGFREARMPDETSADIAELGEYAKSCFDAFEKRTGRRLRMEIEPGTYIVANAGVLVTSVVDEKWTGPDGFEFVVLDGGMEVNARPLYYGSRHPFYVISRQGELLSSEFDLASATRLTDLRVVVGRCCESGDSQCLDKMGNIVPRLMADPEVGDYVVIGGAGAYCSSMTPFNYNSHVQAPEVLLRTDGSFQIIRRTQTLEQMTVNEIPLGRKPSSN
jgi:diaminopimelate decarboxylase